LCDPELHCIPAHFSHLVARIKRPFYKCIEYRAISWMSDARDILKNKAVRTGLFDKPPELSDQIAALIRSNLCRFSWAFARLTSGSSSAPCSIVASFDPIRSFAEWLARSSTNNDKWILLGEFGATPKPSTGQRSDVSFQDATMELRICA
jgi:hypothetical protein